MGIDRKKIEELKGRTEPAAMVVKDAAGLVRAFLACRTAGEVAGLDRKYNRHCRVTGLKADARNPRGKFRRKDAPVWFAPIGREAPESDVLCALAHALNNARLMPEDAPLPGDFWIRAWREFELA